MKFSISHSDKKSKARAGEITTDHGTIQTPIFMPVGTAGTVKAVHQRELKDDIKRANKYSYYQNTWKFLDKQIREGEVSASSVLQIGDKMYLIGGNRRMAFYIGSGINPSIWKIKI